MLTGVLVGGVSPPFGGYSDFNMLGSGLEAYDGVAIIDGGAHPLAFARGTHAAIVHVYRGVTSGHVSGLEVCLDDALGFDVRRPLTARRSRPILRGHIDAPNGQRIQVGMRARDQHERSFDLLAGAGRELMVVGSLRFGQRIVIEGERVGRSLWPFAHAEAAA